MVVFVEWVEYCVVFVCVVYGEFDVGVGQCGLYVVFWVVVGGFYFENVCVQVGEQLCYYIGVFSRIVVG